MTTPENNNNSRFVEIGRKASASWLDASVKGEGGDAMAVEALYIAARVCTFTAVVNEGSSAEPELVRYDFDLSDLRNEPRNADGSVDGKMKTARTVAIADRVFGLSELDNASKQRIRRATDLALYLSERHSQMDDEDYFKAVATRTVKMKHAGTEKMTTCLVVPHGAIFAPPAEDADDEEKQYYERNKDAPQTLHGRDKASLRELAKRAKPAKSTRDSNGSREKDAGKSFNDSVAFVSAIMAQAINPEAEETDLAFSEEQRVALFTLSQQIAAYFSADPLEEEEPIEEKEAANG